MKKLIILVTLVLFIGCSIGKVNNKRDIQASNDRAKKLFAKLGIKTDKNGKITKEQQELFKKKMNESIKKAYQNKDFKKEVNLYIKAQRHAYYGLSLMRQANMDEAIKEIKIAIRIIEKNFPNDIALLASFYHSLGTVYAMMGDGKALIYLKKAIKLTTSSSSLTYQIAPCYHQLAVAYRNIGDYNASLKNYKTSLALKKKYAFPYTNFTSSYVGLADLYNHLGDYTKSLELNQKALLLRPNSLSNSTIYSNMSLSYLKLKNYEKALTYAKKSLKLKKSKFKSNMLFFGGIYALLGEIYFHLENYTQALSYFKKSLDSAQLVSKKRLFIAERYNDIAKTYYQINQLKKAYTQMELGFDMYVTLKENSFLDLNQEHKKTYTSWINQHSNFLESLFQIGYSYKKNQNILNRWLNYKRSIFDIENNLKILYNTSSDKKTKKSIDRLFENQRKLARFTLNPPTDEKMMKYYNKRVKKIKEQISNEEIFLNKKALNLNTKPITYQDISSILKPNELYIDFAKIKNTYFYFTLDKNQNIIFNKIDRDTIDKTIKTIQNTTNRNIKEAKERYGKLYNLIFKKINLKNKTSLIISPDGLLNTIPFEAFYDGKNYLIERVNIRYIPSGKELVKLYTYSSSSNDKVIVFANPLFGLKQNNQNETQLKGSTIEKLYKQGTHFEVLNTDESKIIKRLYGAKSQLYIGARANKRNFFSIKSPKILHLSTHGFYLKDKTILNPMLKAGVALSGANESIKNKNGDGIVTALELSGMDLSQTELVVLSACETGVGELEDGEGVAGMSKAFMKAGAKYVVMSLWSVPEKATGVLMKRFYENLQKGQSYSEALRGAKIWWIEHKHSHPYFWAGFVGSGRD